MLNAGVVLWLAKRWPLERCGIALCNHVVRVLIAAQPFNPVAGSDQDQSPVDIGRDEADQVLHNAVLDSIAL